MTFNDYLESFGGYKVISWNPGDALPDFKSTICRLSIDYGDEQNLVEKFEAYLKTPGAESSPGLVIGSWVEEMPEDGIEEIFEALVNAKERLNKLEVLFFGDLTYEESEVSWIVNRDHGPLLQAYPQLRHYGVRGGMNLSFSWMNLPQLKSLHVQTGGMSAETVKDVCRASLPELEHLELYLGTADYGADYQVADLTPIFEGHFPKLRYLGLKNAQLEDEIAQVVVNSKIIHQLETLDLSLGTLTDEGAQALLNAESVLKLKKLKLAHHFLSAEMQEKLQALPLETDLSDPQNPDDEWRFVSIGE